jgi:hypothetical protein
MDALEGGDLLRQRVSKPPIGAQPEALAQSLNSGVVGTEHKWRTLLGHPDLRQAAPVPLIADQLAAKVRVEW